MCYCAKTSHASLKLTWHKQYLHVPQITLSALHLTPCLAMPRNCHCLLSNALKLKVLTSASCAFLPCQTCKAYTLTYSPDCLLLCHNDHHLPLFPSPFLSMSILLQLIWGVWITPTSLLRFAGDRLARTHPHEQDKQVFLTC